MSNKAIIIPAHPIMLSPNDAIDDMFQRSIYRHHCSLTKNNI